MVEFHGWVTVRDVYSCDMEENPNFDNVIMDIKKSISLLEWCNGFYDLRIINGEYQFMISGYLNHRSKEIEELFDIYKKISILATGSYGLLYIHDDEDKNGYDNVFIVYVLTKGNIKKHIDTYLSPFVGTVEE